MTAITLLGERHSIALKALKKHSSAFFKRLKSTPKGLHIRQINDHLARDIDLSPAKRARHQHKLPSQTDHHPRG